LPPAPPEAANPPPLTERTFSIGGDRTNAWGAEESYNDGPLVNFSSGCAWYVEVGTTALRRMTLPHRPLAVLDPVNEHTGEPAPPGSPLIEDTSSISPPYDWGVKAAIGYRWDGGAIELTGFYLGEISKSHLIADKGRIDLPFTNAPLGFEGDNGLWLHADLNKITHQSAVGNAELNYRCSPVEGCGLEVLVGVRYLDIQERFQVFTDDLGLTVSPPDPFRQGTYSLETHNQILAGQLGLDWEHPLFRWLAFGFIGKGAWGNNFLDQNVTLIRGDGFRAAPGHFSKNLFSHIYETGLYLDWFLCDRVRIRTGYNAMWVVNVAQAAEEVDFNVENRAGLRNDSSTIFYHGPIFEVHVLF
jgi:hypothetical protein